jgi:hypothetical protein
MDWGVVLRWAIVGPSFLACGFITWLAVGNTRAAIRFRDPAPAFYAFARFGLVLIVEVVLELLWHVERIDVDNRAIRYTLGVLMVTVGYAGVLVFEGRREHRDVDRKVT